jgi:hypothetical protein
MTMDEIHAHIKGKVCTLYPSGHVEVSIHCSVTTLSKLLQECTTLLAHSRCFEQVHDLDSLHTGTVTEFILADVSLLPVFLKAQAHLEQKAKWTIGSLAPLGKLGRFAILYDQLWAIHPMLMGCTVNGHVVEGEGTVVYGRDHADALYHLYSTTVNPKDPDLVPSTLTLLYRLDVSERYLGETLRVLSGDGEVIIPSEMRLNLVPEVWNEHELTNPLTCTRALRFMGTPSIFANLTCIALVVERIAETWQMFFPLFSNTLEIHTSFGRKTGDPHGGQDPFEFLPQIYPYDLLESLRVPPSQTQLRVNVSSVDKIIPIRDRVYRTLRFTADHTPIPYEFPGLAFIASNQKDYFFLESSNGPVAFWRMCGPVFRGRDLQTNKPCMIVRTGSAASCWEWLQHTQFPTPKILGYGDEFIALDMSEPPHTVMNLVQGDMSQWGDVKYDTIRFEMARDLLCVVQRVHQEGLFGLRLHPSDLLYVKNRILLVPFMHFHRGLQVTDLHQLVGTLRVILGERVSTQFGLGATYDPYAILALVQYGLDTPTLNKEVTPPTVAPGWTPVPPLYKDSNVTLQEMHLTGLHPCRTFAASGRAVGETPHFLPQLDGACRVIQSEPGRLVVEEPWPNARILSEDVKTSGTFGMDIYTFLESAARAGYTLEDTRPLTLSDFFVDETGTRIQLWNVTKLSVKEQTSALEVELRLPHMRSRFIHLLMDTKEGGLKKLLRDLKSEVLEAADDDDDDDLFTQRVW